jgi:Tol biopolymer transport system component
MITNTLNRIHFVATQASAICLFLLTSCHKESPTQPITYFGEFKDKIAFISVDDAAAITVADLYENAGTLSLHNSKKLTDGVVPEISNDRTWIAFVLVHQSLTPMRVNVDGSGLSSISLDAPVIPQDISISPDGKTVAMTISGWEGTYIGTAPSSGGHFQFVVGDTSRNYRLAAIQPAWSSDGNFIYFRWNDYANRFGHNMSSWKSYIARCDLHGNNITFISDTIQGQSNDQDPSVSPDGSHIAFTSMRSYPAEVITEIFCMKIDGSDVKRLTHGIPGVRQGNHYDQYTLDDAPRWTKDGAYIYFQRQTYTYDKSQAGYNLMRDIYIIKSDGSSFQCLSKNGTSALLKTSTRSCNMPGPTVAP